MKKLALLFVAIALLLGCGYEIIDYGQPELEPFYINNSGVIVKLLAKDMHLKIDSDLNVSYFNSELEIRNNDTLCNSILQENCSNPNWNVNKGFEDFGWEVNKGFEYSEYIRSANSEKPTYFKIEFFTEPKVCLVFDGDDKMENDIRYWENYTFMKKGDLSFVYYFSYTITPELKAMAKEEYCND
ncbi:MAG: hypothetical protein LBC75_02845 [Fibromonadaceae bacterium]|jgi:hypothetical protein|nr:hypothetical protein [Fibromonadaceae bacterium]